MTRVDKQVRAIACIFGPIEILEHAEAVEVFHEAHD